ncbi:MAG TPA: dihydrolipoamide acetyltransferase family protein [Luteitalea sp.]|nr:dihydrolipoamide acetyltransferase family protein [Luteitalea sp.]
MPQMGESVAEGTVVRWIKKVGDSVDRDEPLFEISTDKVDAEIPSPAAGVLLEIRAHEGDTVPIDTVVAVLGEAGSVPTPATSVDSQADGTPAAPQDTSVALDQAPAGDSAAAMAPAPDDASVDADQSIEDLTEARRRQKSSPLVRRIAAEHHVNIAQVSGSGVSGRVTKHDILKFIDERKPTAVAARSGGGLHVPAFQPGEAIEVQPLSVMRRKIAEHMVYSRRTSAHVHTVFEVDFTRVAAARQAQKAEFEQAGARLTFLAFIAKAIADTLRATPMMNAALDGDNIVYKKDVNLGFAVALDWGLIVPVVPKADEKSLLGLAKGIADVAARARAKQLKPEDVQGGTFTITNPGSFGAQFGLPIINQPQVAILGVGTIEKRVVVVDDMIAIRQRGYLTLGFDHRLVDGAVADEFMSRVKGRLESWP